MNDRQIIEAMCRRLNELFEDDLHEWVRVMKEYQLIVNGKFKIHDGSVYYTED